MTNNTVETLQRELEALAQRENEIRQRLYEIQEQTEKLNLEYGQLYPELKGILDKKPLVQHALREAQQRLNKGGQR